MVLACVSAPVEGDGVTHEVSGPCVGALSHRCNELRTGRISCRYQTASIFPFVGQAQSEVASVQDLVDPPAVHNLAGLQGKGRVMPATAAVTVHPSRSGPGYEVM